MNSFPHTPPVVELKNITVEREQLILKNINWRIELGEHWTILGANGSGKTTLLNVLLGFKWPTKGRLFVCGREYGCYDWRELRKHIGMVSSSISQRIEDDETTLNVVASGREAMINYWGKPGKKLKEQALKILKQVECSKLADRKWKYLSQGERQKALIGRALMSDLKILILDEPCAGLDPFARETFLSFINRLIKKKNSPTLIFVTHHVEEIIPAITQTILLKDGQVLASGRQKEILTSENLSKTFETRAIIKRNNGRFELKIRV